MLKFQKYKQPTAEKKWWPKKYNQFGSNKHPYCLRLCLLNTDSQANLSLLFWDHYEKKNFLPCDTYTFLLTTLKRVRSRSRNLTQHGAHQRPTAYLAYSLIQEPRLFSLLQSDYSLYKVSQSPSKFLLGSPVNLMLQHVELSLLPTKIWNHFLSPNYKTLFFSLCYPLKNNLVIVFLQLKNCWPQHTFEHYSPNPENIFCW